MVGDCFHLFIFLSFLLIIFFNSFSASRTVPGTQLVDLFLGQLGEGFCALRVDPSPIRTVVFSLAGHKETTLVVSFANAEDICGCLSCGFHKNAWRLIQLVLHQFLVFLSTLTSPLKNFLKESLAVSYTA